MKSLLIIYHSQSGASARLARAAGIGARGEENISVVVLRACDAGISDVAKADGLVLVAAENSGALSGGSKEFLDRIFYPAIERALVMPYGLLVSAGNDGRGAVAQAERIFRGIPFTGAAEPQIFRGEVSEEHLAGAAEFGQAFAAGLEMGIF